MMATTAWAAALPLDQIIRLDGNNVGDEDVHLMRASDGSFVHTWVHADSTEISGEKRYVMAIQLQIYSKDGQASFGEHGKRLINQPTSSAEFGYCVAEASNGDLLVAYADSRNAKAEDVQTELYIYRFKKDGTPVWPETGVKVPVKHTHTTGVIQALDMQPTFCVSGDNIYLHVYREEVYKDGEKNTAYDNLQLFGINPSNGESLWAILEEWRMAHFEPCENGDAYLLYSADDGKMFGMRVDKNGAYVWSAPVEIGGTVGMGTIMPMEPKCAFDEAGNLMMGYIVYPGTSIVKQQVMNCLTKDGKVLSAPVRGDTISVGQVHKIAYAARGNSMFMSWGWDYPNTSDIPTAIRANAFNSDGSYSWSAIGQNAVTLATNKQKSYDVIGAVPQDNGWVVAYFEQTILYQGNLHVAKLSDAGEVMWTKQVGKDSIDYTTVAMAYDDKNAYIVYASWVGEKGMYTIGTDITDEHNMPSSVANVPEERKGNMKIMRNGMLYIIRDGKMYNAQGARVE